MEEMFGFAADPMEHKRVGYDLTLKYITNCLYLKPSHK